MACRRCKKIVEDSYKGPPQSSHLRTYICSCGQRWWCFNTVLNLWGMVNDDATWKNVQEGCPEVVSVGRIVKLVD